MKHCVWIVLYLLMGMMPGLVAGAAPKPAGGVGGFSFIQISDTHLEPIPGAAVDSPKQRSIGSLREIRAVFGGDGGTTSGATGARLAAGPGADARPAFLIHTGDVTEFGYAGATEGFVKRVLDGFGVPVYATPGNHDQTWCADTSLWRARWGGVDYAFSHGGVRFLCLNSAAPQDPAPCIAPETLAFLKGELERLGPDDPIIICLHHPFSSTEFASRYDTDRLLDLVRPYNVVLMLTGHGHRAMGWSKDGQDWVMGGSTFSPKGDVDGYNLVTITSTSLVSKYHYLHAKRAPTVLMNKSLARGAGYPAIRIEAPAEGQLVASEALEVRAAIAGTAGAKRVEAVVDDAIRQPLTFADGAARGTVALAGLANGMHTLRVEFAGEGRDAFHKSVAFRLARVNAAGQGRLRWARACGGGFKSAPVVAGGRVYLGSLNGRFYALDAATGDPVWAFEAGSEILATAAVTRSGRIVFGTGAGELIVLNTDGREAGRFKSGAAIYGAPALDERGICYAGTNRGELIAYDPERLALRWKQKIAGQAIESAPWVEGGRVYAGAWDGYLYCVDAADGKVIWKRPGPTCQKRVNRYYSPADDGPKLTGGKLWATDRGFLLGRYGLDGRFEAAVMRGTAAAGVAGDGQALYLRRLGAGLAKVGVEGVVLWENKDVVLGRLPLAPVERGGRVYASTNIGLLKVLDACDGKLLWTYQVTPQQFVFSNVAVQGSVVFTAGMDGVVSAIAPPENER